MSYATGLTAIALTSVAFADRADQNATTSAEDAFGTSNGYQSIGLYSTNDARGFNPQQAGNLRIEGLYFDTPTNYVSPCLVNSTTMHIGIAAQSYDFPSPTGIADLTLFAPDRKAGVSGVVDFGSYAERGLLAEGHGPMSEHVAGSACVELSRHFFADTAFESSNVGTSAFLRWRPTASIDVRPFVSHVSGGQHRIIPIVYTDAMELPPLFTARNLGAQDYTSVGWGTTIVGAIARFAFGTEWSLSAGLFRVIESDPQIFNEEYLSVLPDRTADHVLDVVPPLHTSSTSGEWQLTRHFGGSSHSRTIELILRGRKSTREFGGDAIIDYGVRSIDLPLTTQRTAFATSAVSTDDTSQLDAGVLYEERWKDVGSLGFGVLRGHYRRAVTYAGAPGLAETVTPWLPNVRFTADPAHGLTLYGSYVQGLEDSALAPSSAENRGEPPPATRSRQFDAGIRYAPREKWSLLVGAFEIQKPYFNLDAADIYTALGLVRHRGIESSLDVSTNGITVVAGTVWLHPHVERTIPEPGVTGTVPLGPIPFLLNLNVDCAPPEWRRWAASMQLTRLSSRVATSDDRFSLPPLTTVAAGIRYSWRLASRALTLRLDGINLTNARGLHLTSVGLVTPELGRRFMLTVAADD